MTNGPLPGSSATPAGRADEGPNDRLELVHVVWLRALDHEPVHEPADTLDLVQLARNDQSVLQHAIGYGKAHRDELAEEGRASQALRTLEEALALVGPPRTATFS